MKDEIIRFLTESYRGKRSDKATRQLVADHFGGTVNGRYVKIREYEYYIKSDPDTMPSGYDVRKMNWNANGNDWKFYKPY